MGRLGGPILLVPQSSLPAAAKDYITAAKASIASAFAYGGSVVVSADVLTAVQDALA